MVLNGIYYDIATIKIHGNSVQVSCIEDSIETELINWLDHLPNKKGLEHLIQNFLLALFFIPFILILFPKREFFHTAFFYKFGQYNSPNFMFFPPPKV